MSNPNSRSRNNRNGQQRSRTSSGYSGDGQNRRNNENRFRMGFKFVESLLENPDVESVLLILNNDRNGFKELLVSKITDDMTVLLVKLLCKIGENSFTESKVRVLQMALDNEFMVNLENFISGIAHQDRRQKNFNKHFWSDTDEFWNSVILMCRLIHDLTPITSCEKTLDILQAMIQYIPIIENNQTIRVSYEINQRIQKLIYAIENSFNKGDKDFRDVSVHPNRQEITVMIFPRLKPNIVQGPYQSVNHYLDIHFRLLREDFVTPLRRGICNYLNKNRDCLDDIKIYKTIVFLNTEAVNEQNCYRIQYKFSNRKKTLHTQKSKRLITGCLLCFTNNNFKSVMIGKVVQHDMKNDAEKGQLIVGFNEDVMIPDNIFEDTYLMAESKVFFEPYYQVLNVLKRIKTDNFPMEKYIIDVRSRISAPKYLENNQNFFTIENQTFYVSNWGQRKFFGLNEAQQAAFKGALTKEFCIIQGPPGTGKTHLALKIAHTLIQNNSIWYKKTPMLVVCFTNHALDQFLEGLLPVTEKIVRIGNQSKNEKLNKYNIRYKRYNNKTPNPTLLQMKRQVKSLLQQISKIDEVLKQIGLNQYILDFSVFSDIIVGYEDSWFSRVKKEPILKWLFDSRDNIKFIQQNFSELQIEDDTDEEDNIDDDDYESCDEEEIDDYYDMFDDITTDYSKPYYMCLNDLSSELKMLTDSLVLLEQNTSLKKLEKNRRKTDIMNKLDRLRKDYVFFKSRLAEAARGVYRAAPDYINLHNPYLMTTESRWHLYFYWLRVLREKLLEKRKVLDCGFRRDYKVLKEMQEITDVQLMKEELVVGMTTTAAARLKSSLDTLKCPIVIVEEAAEVLEAHIISSLPSKCQHLILIGDHQQLKPSTGDYAIEKEYLLGISLFERMVKNKIEYYQLNVQHRMRPEISSLISPSIYPNLKNHDSVLRRDPIRGVKNSVYFIDHQEHEASGNDKTKKNIHEAKFLINLARYFVLNGYDAEKITILTAYMGQKQELLLHRRQYKSLLHKVRVDTLDNYQGEENDIILLSLVRNNQNNIGFLKIENRVCVALSRARNGFYIMGNMDLLCRNSNLWVKVKQSLEKLNAIGPYLPLMCQANKHCLGKIKTAEDIMKIPIRKCKLVCNTPLRCGHTCKNVCHTDDQNHVSYNCFEKCKRISCGDKNHVCQKLCCEDCGPCRYQVEWLLDCGHKVVVDCCTDATTYQCKVVVQSVLPCGHKVKKPCFEDPNNVKCPHPCAVRLPYCDHTCTQLCHIRADPNHVLYICKVVVQSVLPCGHKVKKRCFEDPNNVKCPHPCAVRLPYCDHTCTQLCHIRADPYHSMYQCKEPCNLQKAGCSVQGYDARHMCSNICFQPCETCNVMVEKIVPDCGHQITVRCCEEANRKLCKEQCPRLLPCDHKCMRRCNEVCIRSVCQVQLDCQIVSPCGHVIRNIPCGIKYQYTVNSVDPKDLLPLCAAKCNTSLKCGHVCTGSCGDCLQGRFHQRCKESCGASLICSHKCQKRCSQSCGPCDNDCTYRCAHNKCPRKCSEECNKCTEPCTRRCQHQQCKKMCWELCSVPPCKRDCQKLLNCGHACVGFCGDPCPVLCKICDYDQLTEFYLGNENKPNAKYVMLTDCDHVFESEDMEKWLRSGGEVAAKHCPKCETAITGTDRYSEYIKRSMSDIANVSKVLFDYSEENNRRCMEFLSDIGKIGRMANVTFRSYDSHFFVAVDRLKQKLQWYSESLHKTDLDVIHLKLQILESILNACSNGGASLKYDGDCLQQINLICKTLTRDNDYVTQQEIEDMTLEIERLSRIYQYKRIKLVPNFSHVKYKHLAEIQRIEELFNSTGRYDKERDASLQLAIFELSKLNVHSISVTAIEKPLIVAPFDLKKGHWFKCRKGHYSAVTECRGSSRALKCTECGTSGLISRFINFILH